MSGFSNRPKILRGAFVEYGLNIPPLVVPFQFNPEQLSRSRSVTYYGEEYQEPVTDRNEAGNEQRRTQLKQRTHSGSFMGTPLLAKFMTSMP